MNIGDAPVREINTGVAMGTPGCTGERGEDPSVPDSVQEHSVHAWACRVHQNTRTPHGEPRGAPGCTREPRAMRGTCRGGHARMNSEKKEGGEKSRGNESWCGGGGRLGGVRDLGPDRRTTMKNRGGNGSTGWKEEGGE